VTQDQPGHRPRIDASVASIARIYDYWLGGKDNFKADREAAELMIQQYPDIVTGVRKNRAFLGRAVHYLTVAHPASDVDQHVGPALRQLNTRMGGTRAVPRSHEQVLSFFDGLEMVEPGLVQLHRWRPGSGVDDTGRDLAAYGGVARKP
jgi:hypothetical protein